MKILEVLDCYYPKFDGPTLVITSYSKSFQKHENTEVEVLVPKVKKYKDVQPFKVNRCFSIPGPENYNVGLPAFDCKMKKHLKNSQFDIIHYHSPFTMGKFIANFGKKNKIPTIFTFHTKYKEDFARDCKLKITRKFMMWYIMRNIRKADYVFTVSNGAADCLREYGYKGEIKVIRNGTDLVYPANANELIEKVNEKYNIADEQNVFLSVGRIVENKKLDLSLQALKIVKEKGYKFKFLIVGAGTYETKLKENCTKLGLDDSVIFTGKIMDRELLSAHYLRSNLFLFPSTFDTASLAPIEAAAMKLPVLMTEGCSTAEIITKDVNGLLAEPTPEKWAEEIIKIIENKEFTNTLRENCFKQVYRSWDSVADEVLQAYDDIIKEYKANHSTKNSSKQENI